MRVFISTEDHYIVRADTRVSYVKSVIFVWAFKSELHYSMCCGLVEEQSSLTTRFAPCPKQVAK